MGRVLRVGFAMGGGVSMGTFSGVALGEALKLLALYGGYEENGEKIPYDDIVIDLFSGASAGALSLFLMLRALTKPDPKLMNDMGSEQNLRNWLKELHTDAPTEQIAEGSPRWKKLLAAQYVQDLQRKLWVDEINIDKLCDPNAEGMASKASLLNRGELERICADYLSFNNDFSFTERTFLQERVLFACSLSNLSPITFNARRDSLGRVGAGDGTLTDGMTSPVRKDMRVFDLWFSKPPQEVAKDQRLSPERWFRYYTGAAITKDAEYGNLAGSKAWARMASTAIACGCFPLAFEPVVLPRKEFEYPPNVWEGMFEDALHLGDIGLPKEFPFTYMDGGVFNNEPIREAYRMAAFIDSAALATDEGNTESDRLILFVDPTTGTDTVPYTLPFHSDLDIYKAHWSKPQEKSKVREKDTLSKLLTLLPSVLGAFIDEGRVVEKDKIGATREKFLYRENARNQVLKLPFHKMSQDELSKTAVEVWKFCSSRLKHEFMNELIPLGTLTIDSEFKRILAEHNDAFTPEEATMLTSCSFDIDHTKSTAIPDCIQENTELLAAFVKLLYCVAIDLLMELEGKPKGQKLISIAPWDLRLENGKLVQERIELPADELAAFAGFISPIANNATVPAAELCTRKYMFHSGLLAMAPENTVSAAMDRRYSCDFTIKSIRDEIAEKGEALTHRIDTVIKRSTLLEKIPAIDGLVLWFGKKKATNELREMLINIPPSNNVPIRFKVSENSKLYLGDGNYISGRVYGLRPTLNPKDGSYYLPLELKYRPPKYDMKQGEWHGDFVTPEGNGIVTRKLRMILGPKTMSPIPFPPSELITQATYYPGYYLKYDLTDDENIRDPNHWSIVSSEYEPLENKLAKDL